MSYDGKISLNGTYVGTQTREKKRRTYKHMSSAFGIKFEDIKPYLQMIENHDERRLDAFDCQYLYGRIQKWLLVSMKHDETSSFKLAEVHLYIPPTVHIDPITKYMIIKTDSYMRMFIPVHLIAQCAWMAPLPRESIHAQGKSREGVVTQITHVVDKKHLTWVIVPYMSVNIDE